MKRITIKDLAKELSLSTSTVSRAFVNDKNINGETKQRILETAGRLGYKPNPTALDFRKGQSKNIGFIVPEMVTPFSATVLKGIQNVLNTQGYRTIILTSDEDPVKERHHLQLLEQINVDAVIINLCHESYNLDLYQQMIKRGIPLVFFDRIPHSELDASKVLADDHIKASLMVEHLIETGRRNIAHIVGPSFIRNAREREKGYKRILTKYKIYNPDLIVRSEGMTYENGKQSTEELLSKNILFDAVFAFTDTLAIGSMHHLLDMGVKVPQEVAVASFSGTELSKFTYPQLTTVEQPLVEMGENVAELVLEKINNKISKSKTVIVDSKIIYRDSTRRSIL